ncbi:MAG TPA: hypothetical protein PLH94_03405 [Fimbriimonadaceae bacterium]|nr:hypothetical protein [Fimbriimonadaceae bacterium]
MDCRDCPRYDDGASRCRDGKLNPVTWGEAVDVGNIYGIRAICTFNDHRERLVRARGVRVPIARPLPR